MTSKVIDIFNSLSLISNYNINGSEGTQGRIIIDSDGVMSIFNTMQSTNSSTGALIVQGGGLSINSGFAATSPTNGGSLTVKGGAAISGDIIVGGNIIFDNPYASSTLAYLTLTSTNPSISLTNGSFITYGGISIQNITNAIDVTNGGGLTVAGGVAIGKDIIIGGKGYLTDLESTNITTSNLLVLNENVSNSNIISASIGNLNVFNGLNSNFNSNSIGSVIFTTGGNVGINTTSPIYKLDVNGSYRIKGTDGVINLIASSTLNDTLQIQNINSSGGSSFQFLNNSGSATCYMGYNNPYSSQLQNNMYILSAPNIPIKIIAGNKINNPVIFNSVDNSVSITTTTSSYDTSSGSLQISGGVSIQGNLNIGGQLNVNSPFTVNFTNTQTSINSTTGALKLVGGLSINLADTLNSNSTSYTAGGSLTVSGGIAIAQDIFIGGILDIKSGTNNINPIKIQSLQISSNYNSGTATIIQSGDAFRTSNSFTPIQFSGWNDQNNPKISINSNDLTLPITTSLIALSTTNTLGNLFTNNGNVGIGTTNPNAPLQISNDITNRKIVVYEDSNNDHQYHGFGVNPASMRYQVSDVSADHVFYAGVNSTSSNELFRIKGSGDVIITGTTNSQSISTGNLFSNNIVSNNNSIASLNVSVITAANINFTGNLFQNNIPYNATQWIGPINNNIFYGSSGNINVGIGTSNPTFTLDVNGTLRVSNTQISINSSIGSMVVLGGISISNTADTSSILQGGSLTIAGGASISKSLSIGNYINLSGTSSIFSGSFVADNNNNTPSDINGLFFPSANIRSFTAIITISILRTSGGNYFSQYTIEGIQTDSGWFIDEVFVGDITGISFNITNAGQLQYTSSNLVNWSNTTMRYNGNMISISGNYIPNSLNSTGNFNVTGILSVYSSNNSTTTSNGALQVTGGIGITKNITIGGNLIFNGNSYVFGGAFNANNGPSTNSIVTGLIFPSSNYRSFFIQMGISITNSNSIYSQYTIEGIQRNNGWSIYTSTLGDTIDIVFSIDNLGQLLYTSTTTYSGWVSSIFNYQATAISITGNNIPITLPTSGNQTITGSLTITNTNNSTSTSSGALSVNGGISCASDLIVGGNLYALHKYAIIEDQKTNGTPGGTQITGSYVNRTLNTIIINTINLTLSNNQFTLPIGTYRIEASAPGYECNRTKIRLQNITDNTTISLGTSCYANTNTQTSKINSIFSIDLSKTFTIQQYFENSISSLTGGVETSNGDVEVYTRVFITKLL